jgi:hypothetical protein
MGAYSQIVERYVGDQIMSPIEAWAFGYALARGYHPPEPVPVGLWMEVGTVEQRGRFVLRHFDPMMFGNLVRSIDASGVYIEAFAPREAVVPLLPENWIVRERAYLMVTELTAPATLPATSSYESVAIDEGPRSGLRSGTNSGA